LGRPVWPPLIGRVTESSPAAAAGLRTGDLVLAVNGRPIRFWEDLERVLATADGRPLELRVRHDGAQRTVSVTPKLRTLTDPGFHEGGEVWDIGAGPQLLALITSVAPNSPAARAGLKPGDVVHEIAGEPMYVRDEVLDAIRNRPGQTFPITVERDGQRL